tara:strand:+ start:3660 stop:4460 length:801 start_codon:yes stop_codon:yes gene_type:complete
MGTGIGVGIAGEVYDLKPGTATPPPSCTTDYSLEFDGITEFGKSLAGPILGTTGAANESFTINVWLKAPVLGINMYIMDAQTSPTPTQPQGGWALRMLPNGAVSFRTNGGLGGGSNISVISAAMTANTWHMISIVVDMTVGAAYAFLDGVANPPVNTSNRNWISISNNSFLLGRTGTGGYFNGFMCHLSFWDKGLTASQLGELYTNNTGKCYVSDFSFSSALKNYYPTFNPTGTYTDPLTDIVGGVDISLANMSSTNVSTEHPPQL